MKVEYSPRAIRDLTAIGAYYRSTASEKVAHAVAERMRHVVNLIAQHPFIAPRVRHRSGVRVAVVLQYPYLIFIAYTLLQWKSSTSVIPRVDLGLEISGSPLAQRAATGGRFAQ